MSFELLILGLVGLLWVVQLALLSVAANLQLGPAPLLGPRDAGVRLEGRAARLQRAFDNLTEGLVPFVIAVLLVALGPASSTALTQACALVYLLARLLYLPAYVFGWSPWRSLIWTVGFLATVLLLLAGLAPALAG